jgi:hypothetical protein
MVGYSEDSKAYIMFFPDHHRKMVSRDVKFEDNLASRKFQDLPIVAEGPHEVGPKDDPRVETYGARRQTLVEVEEQLSPSNSVKRPRCFKKNLWDAWEHVEPPRSTFRERKPSQKFSHYIDLMTNIIHSDPSIFEEASNQHVWSDSMVEKHNSIMRNDV